MRNRRYIAVVVMMFISVTAFAQVTIQSPYSRFGLGNLKGSNLPQFRGMGGVSTGIGKVTGFNNINVANPATYATIALATADAGMQSNFTTLSRGALSEKSFNATFSHIALAFNITPRSGLSFGVMPYSEMGYEFTNPVKIDTLDIDYVYTGEGGLNKAYLGYGYQFGDHFRIGANVEYLFGNMIQSQTTKFLNEPTIFDTRTQNKDNVYGLAFSYGAQFDIPLNSKVSVTFGYSGSSSSTINSRQTSVVTRLTRDFGGNENPVMQGDTIQLIENAPNKLKLPLSHSFGISISKFNNWVFGADFRMTNWSDMAVNGVGQGLQNSYGASVGGSFIPNASAVSGYFNHVDYRFGVQYDKTYVRISNTDIKQMSASLGFGFPFVSSNRFTFSKLNFTTELGKRGTLQSNLVKETFVNFHLGLTLNDRWFSRFKFD